MIDYECQAKHQQELDYKNSLSRHMEKIKGSALKQAFTHLSNVILHEDRNDYTKELIGEIAGEIERRDERLKILKSLIEEMREEL